MKQKETRILSR